MAYNSPKKFSTKNEFMIDRIPMLFGSLANLHSNSTEKPSSDELFSQAISFCDKIWSFGQRYDEFPELEQKLKEKFEEEQHEKKIGRYSSSELWALLNNKIPPNKYLEARIFDEESKRKMQWGTIIHEGIQNLFGFEENKYEIKIADDIVIVGKIDLELEDLADGTAGKLKIVPKIFEFKTREDIEAFDEVPSWYLLQCMCYLKMKEIKEMTLYLIGWGLTRRKFIVKWDEKIWEDIVNGLKDYHLKIIKAYAERKSDKKESN